jgi:hypothetical protein
LSSADRPSGRSCSEGLHLLTLSGQLLLHGEDKLACNADLDCATMVAIKMAVESFRQSKTLLWDAKQEKVKTVGVRAFSR